MGTPKIMSRNELMRIVGVSHKQNKKITWHGHELVVKQFLSVPEYMTVVKNIIHDCRSPDNELVPELFDFAIKINIIAAYAFVDLPDDLEELYYVVYASDLYDTVCGLANNKQIEAIKSAIDLYVNNIGGV